MRRAITLVVTAAFAMTTATATLAAGPRGKARQAAPGVVQPGTVQVGPDLPTPADVMVAEVSKTAYHGSRILPKPAKVDNRFESEVAARLSALDFVPSQRLEHFRWCSRDGLLCNGWLGCIDRVAPDPRGTLVTVRITPRLESPTNAITSTPDCLVETYLLSGGKFIFLGAAPAPDAKPGTIFGY